MVKQNHPNAKSLSKRLHQMSEKGTLIKKARNPAFFHVKLVNLNAAF